MFSWLFNRNTQSRTRTADTAVRLQLEQLGERVLPSANFGLALRAGGTAIEEGRAVAVDTAGNIYVTGSFRGTADFDPGAGVYNLSSATATSDDAFVAKYSSTGAVVWAHRFGSTVHDNGYGIALDSSGNVYVTGRFVGTVDFDPSSGAANLISSQNFSDAFVLKLTSAGGYVWAKQLKGTYADAGNGIAVSGGNVYVTGSFAGTADFDPGIGTVTMTAQGIDPFVWKLTSGGDYVWGRAFVGTGSQDSGNAIAVDATGNIYTTGNFQGTTNFGSGTNLTTAGYQDVYVCKLTSSGVTAWAGRYGSKNNDVGTGIAVDATGNVYTTGYFQGSVDFDPGAGTYNLNGGNFDQIFVNKLSTSGAHVWTRQIGRTTNHDRAHAIAVDSAGRVYTTGYFTGVVDFDPGAGTFNLTSGGTNDGFVSILDGNGNFLDAYQYRGRPGGLSYGYGIALDSAANVFTTGIFSNTVDFDPSGGTFNLTSAGSRDIFVNKLDPVL